jgi:hypothetical protein
VSATVAAAAGTSTGARRGPLVALVAAVLAVAVLVVLTSRASPTPAFSIESSAPDGYRALALLAEELGAQVDTAGAASLRPSGAAAGADVVVIPVPSRLDDDEQEAVERLARAGATVVLGGELAPVTDEWGFMEGPQGAEDRDLADVEASATEPGVCDIAALGGLGAVDAAFAVPQLVPAAQRSCYGDGTQALVVQRDVGEGRIVTLADPHLWVNARLQPAKEEGGEPLDNAAMALRLTGAAPGVRLVVLDGTAGSGGAASGARDPLELLPLPVKLALVQAAVALLLYLWWRGRRLGRPVAEPLPVEIAASELVVAVGDLLRRRGSVERAAAVMRFDTRRELSSRLGLPAGAPPDALVTRVAERTGRPVDAVGPVLLDPVPSRDEDLVRLAHELDSIRQEVLDDQPVR